MLEIHSKSQIKINPNEEIRRQFIEIIKKYDELSDDLYDEVYDILNILKENNYLQYCVTLQLMYKDVYAYFNYANKCNETNKTDKQRLTLVSICSKGNLIENIEKNLDLFMESFLYIIDLNNIFRTKILLELNQKQNEFLLKIAPYHMYDLLALQDYLGFRMLHDYYLENIDNNSKVEQSECDDDEITEEEVEKILSECENSCEEREFKLIPEEIVEDIINFLNYLYYYHKDVYIKIIKEVIEKIYKWCYYYINNSTEVEDIDLEVRILNLISGCNLDQICEKIKDNQKILFEILLRIFDDIDMGYPNITTSEGNKVVTEEELNEYMTKTKRKQK